MIAANANEPPWSSKQMFRVASCRVILPTFGHQQSYFRADDQNLKGVLARVKLSILRSIVAGLVAARVVVTLYGNEEMGNGESVVVNVNEKEKDTPWISDPTVASAETDEKTRAHERDETSGEMRLGFTKFRDVKEGGIEETVQGEKGVSNISEAFKNDIVGMEDDLERVEGNGEAEAEEVTMGKES
ncbi:hypothetical protein BJV74DRAFT_795444 [Russula compacta]|nr:hypothetical protein BJV74DRAFT_795444 [Russula compacta]